MAKIKGPFLVIGQVVNLLICDPNEEIISKPVKSLSVDIHSGIEDDKHKERVSDTREEEMANFGLPKGTKIANDRQFSAISTEQMEEIKNLMGLPSAIPDGLLGENIVISGIPNFSLLPIGTKLFFKNADVKRTAVLIVRNTNGPCKGPGNEIQRHFPDIPNLMPLFVKVSQGKRGVVGSIYSSGSIHVGDKVFAYLPKPHGTIWKP